jgi:adenylate cyclase class IV
MNEIGFTKRHIMEKYRLLWFYKDMEFYIDELPFGVYLEIKGEKKEIDKIITLLRLKESEAIKLTYWEIYSKLNNDINAENIVFDCNHVFKISTL